jgi:hypothetical protein
MMEQPMFYDKDGTPIEKIEYFDMKYAELGYKRVAETFLPDGKWVSTVWLGINHNFGVGPPIIFETMVFPSKDDFSQLDMDRYATLAEAEAGHIAMVERWNSMLNTEDTSCQS